MSRQRRDLIPAGSVTSAGLTREVVELSALTHLPLRVLGYEGSTLVRRIDFSNVKLRADRMPVNRSRVGRHVLSARLRGSCEAI